MDILDLLHKLYHKYQMSYDNAVNLIKYCKKNEKIKLLENGVLEEKTLDVILNNIYKGE